MTSDIQPENEQPYVCNQNGHCISCVAHHHDYGGIPICFKTQSAKMRAEQLLRIQELERIEAEKQERERIEQERIQAEKEAEERKERERLEAERKEQERKEQEKIEAAKKEQERKEKERLEAERKEQERKERERFERQRFASSPPYIEVFFRCCSVYGKLYLKINEAHYVGRCPKCKAKVTAPAGSNAPRFGLKQ